MEADLFPALDELLQSAAPGEALGFLIARFIEAREYGLLFEARLMKKRLELGLPLIQSEALVGDDYQEAMVDAALEVGGLFLREGNIARAWPYFRAISDNGPVAAAIAAFEPVEGTDDLDPVIQIAFQEGVHPLKGLSLILARHGMCRAITSFGMHAVERDREKCIALLTRTLHSEIVSRMGGAIEAHEGLKLASQNLTELMQGRDWLFGEWDYYVDTSHLLSLIPYCVEVTDPAVLELFGQLCDYGARLAPQFQSPGVPPFENQCVAYGHYVGALLGKNTEVHLDYFRQQVTESDPEIVGDAPGRALVRLLISLNRHAEALDVLLNHVFEDAQYGAPVPSALQLCYRARDFGRMKELARDRGDLLSYAASSIQSRAD